jgi:hypothetical protein
MPTQLSQNGFGKRPWVKLWVGEWLDGTTRYEMTGAQRAFWIDLLAMAGRSRQPGVICAGPSGDRVIGYPLSVFQGLDAGGELDIPATFQLFEACGKIRVELIQETPIKLYKIEILNWAKYQSNLAGQAERARKYRQNKRDSTTTAQSRDASRARHAPRSRSVTGVDVEGDIEGEGEKPSRASHAVNSASSPDYYSVKTDIELLKVTTEIWDYYLQTFGKNPKINSFTTKRKQKGLARLREALAKTGGDMERAKGLMRSAVDALAASSFHRGSNPDGRVYDSWEGNLFASLEKFEWWLNRAVREQQKGAS